MNFKQILYACVILLASLSNGQAMWCCCDVRPWDDDLLDYIPVDVGIKSLNRITKKTSIRYDLLKTTSLESLVEREQVLCRLTINDHLTSISKNYTPEDYVIDVSYRSYPSQQDTQLYQIYLTQWVSERQKKDEMPQKSIVVLWNTTEPNIPASSSSSRQAHLYSHSFTSFSSLINVITGRPYGAQDLMNGGFLGYPNVYFSEDFSEVMRDYMKEELKLEQVSNKGAPIVKVLDNAH